VLKGDDLIDLIVQRLLMKEEHSGGSDARSSPQGPAVWQPRVSHPPMAPRGRVFLTEYEIKKRLTPRTQQLTIPREAILSPLALEWLALEGIKIVRE
jgi:hypothetical protein